MRNSKRPYSGKMVGTKRLSNPYCISAGGSFGGYSTCDSHDMLGAKTKTRILPHLIILLILIIVHVCSVDEQEMMTKR